MGPLQSAFSGLVGLLSVWSLLAMTQFADTKSISNDISATSQDRKNIRDNKPSIEETDYRNGIIDPAHLWTEYNLYMDNEDFTNDEIWEMILALDELVGAIPCLPFVLRYSSEDPPFENDYVHIKKGEGCTSSATGKQGGVQYLTFGPGCFQRGKLLHEIIHSLGLHHEQSRPDRDEYVTILWENIEVDKQHFFEKLNDSVVSTYGVPYNLKSIMHSSPLNYSSNGQPTMVAKNEEEPVGNIGELQESDVVKLRRMYNCSLH